ncbi:unnamed protein product [Cylindrotheca closterium]|uniref:Uncharacterized protein n=1 Tax=Cylindrotheca closterium TaxID=2856 RepID=A0AAD2FI86_9STRA|nr:unnamed protein product [Cylindrotheca closterium]
MTFVAAGRNSISKIGRIAARNSWFEAARKVTTKTDRAKTKSKMTWSRGYLGVGSDTKAPDATFVAVASVVLGAGFYAWFIDPPKER